MARSTDNDWEIIRQEMEIEANSRRFERRMKGIDALNTSFLNCFPRDKRNKISDIETFILSLPLIVLFMYVLFRLAFPR